MLLGTDTTRGTLQKVLDRQQTKLGQGCGSPRMSRIMDRETAVLIVPCF